MKNHLKYNTICVYFFIFFYQKPADTKLKKDLIL